MTEYTIKAGGILAPVKRSGLPVFLTILNTEEFRERKDQFSRYKDLLHSLGSIRYCKMEVYEDCAAGTLRIPQKKEGHTPLLSFGVYMMGQALFLIEDTGDLKHWIEKLPPLPEELHAPDQLLLQFLNHTIDNDLFYLSHLERKMESLEDSLNEGADASFFEELTSRRQKLSELNAYYGQLSAIGELFQSPACAFLIRNAAAWAGYTRSTERLRGDVQLLRENILQLRELYQARQDARQNKIMGILTVVTTLFLPLTLLTGWYGMNFAHMPELHWEYGYPAVILVAVLIVVLEILYFKKKKFF